MDRRVKNVDETEKRLQSAMSSKWVIGDKNATQVVTREDREIICDCYGSYGYADGERKIARRICDDHNEVEALRQENARLRAVIQSAVDASTWSAELGTYLCGDAFYLMEQGIQQAQEQARD